MSEIHRLYRYKGLLSSRRVVPKTELLSRLEISEATLKRDLAKLRDQFNWPIDYDRDQGGYRLATGHEDVELPGMWFSPDELASLVTIQHLLAQLAPGLLGGKLAPLRTRLEGLMKANGLDVPSAAGKIRLVQAGKRFPPMSCFETVALSTLSGTRLQIIHYSRQQDDRSERTISPLRLVHYRDNWYVDAWCHLRHAVRSFAIDAIEKAVPTKDPVEEVDDQQLDAFLSSSYGIFTGQPKDWVLIRFSPLRSRWVRHEQWHPNQVMRLLPDGSLELEFPYSDERELIGDVLRFGSEAEVIRPKELRGLIAENLITASQRYALKK